MSKINNKYGWLFGLVIMFVGVLLLNGGSIKTLANSISVNPSEEYYSSSSSDDYDNVHFSTTNGSSDDLAAARGMCLFMEAFCTIHMTVFVLIPLSRIFGGDKHKKLFWTLFLMRVVILLIGNFFINIGMAIIDFFAIFIGAFLVVPICAGIKGIPINKKSNQVIIPKEKNAELKTGEFGVSFDANGDFGEVGDNAMATLGFGDKDIVKRGLAKHYEDIIGYYTSRNYDELVKLCSPGIYTTYKNDIELYDKLGETKVIKNIQVIDNRIVKAEKIGKQLFIELDMTYTCLDYVTDSYGRVVKGSETTPKKYRKNLTFSKLMSGEFVTTCPSCNASINEDSVEFCSYCGTALNYKVGDWVLKRETTSYME